MRNAVILAAGAAVITSSAALADVSGIVGQDTLRYFAADGSTDAVLEDASFAVLDVFVRFDAENTHGYNNADSHMLSAFNFNLFTDTLVENFYQNDLTGQGSGAAGSWKPSFSFDIPGTANPRIDSFITIGGGVGNEAAVNATTPDPNLGSAINSAIFNDNIGWFLNPPTSTQGDQLDLEVWIGRFVVTGDEARNGANFNMAGTIGYNYGSGTGSFNNDVDSTFFYGEIPAPGALALLGLGGLCARRRRA
jgi:hypothetical protein